MLLLGWSVGWSGGWSVGRLVGWSVGRWVGRSVGLLVGWSVGLLVGRSVGWSVGRLVDRSTRRQECLKFEHRRLYMQEFLTAIRMGPFRHKTKVDSGRFRSIRDFSTALPLTDNLGICGKCAYTWVRSVQPPQPYIILRGAREHREGGWEVE